MSRPGYPSCPLSGEEWLGLIDGSFYELCKLWGRRRRSEGLRNDLEELFSFLKSVSGEDGNQYGSNSLEITV